MKQTNYNSEWKLNRKRFYLRTKDKEKILDTEYYKGRDVGNIEYVIQNYLNDKEQLPFRVSYDFKFYEDKWLVDIYTYETESFDFVDKFYEKNKERLFEKYPKCKVVEYGKFWMDNDGRWYLGGSQNDYRLFLDTIEVEHQKPKEKVNYRNLFFGVDFGNKKCDVEVKELLNIKYNW